MAYFPFNISFFLQLRAFLVSLSLQTGLFKVSCCSHSRHKSCFPAQVSVARSKLLATADKLPPAAWIYSCQQPTGPADPYASAKPTADHSSNVESFSSAKICSPQLKNLLLVQIVENKINGLKKANIWKALKIILYSTTFVQVISQVRQRHEL